MTTIKECKTMMEGATDAPWVVIYDEDIKNTYVIKAKDEWNICEVCSCIDSDDSGEKHANIIATLRNIAPELIRVIELAYGVIDTVANYSDVLPHQVNVEIQQSLSEIRKLKGE